MKLKKLQLTGFKSFSDKTVIEFPEGISAIVGPNGCGKSNIVDALRWVMGEQSVKQLRGKSMEDVIFAGADGKPATNMAEVTLTISNDNGSVPEEFRQYSEIMVTRRLYRSGESAYLLNKQPCRLKDIHNLFMGSGMGAKTYAVIQQGNVGAITEAGPDERRIFIEEAAGITRYKVRKKEAIRKLEATRSNLDRLDDIISEVKKQLTLLDRQAKKAVAYRDHQEKLRKYESLAAILRHRILEEKEIQTQALISGLEDKESAEEGRMKVIDAAIERIRLHLTQIGDNISGLNSKKYDLERAADRYENDLVHMRQECSRLENEITAIEGDKKELAGKIQELYAEKAKLEEESRSTKERIENLKEELGRLESGTEEVNAALKRVKADREAGKSRLMRLAAEEARYKNICQTAYNNSVDLKKSLALIKKEKKNIKGKLISAESRLEKLVAESDRVKEKIRSVEYKTDSIRGRLEEQRRIYSRQVKELQELEVEKNRIFARYSTLKKMDENFEWYKDGVKTIMTEARNDPGSDVIGLLSNAITPEPGFEVAVEAALGERLQAVIVPNIEAGFDKIRALNEKNGGRCFFLPADLLKTGKRNSSDKSGHILDHIKISPGFEEMVASLFQNVYVAENIEEAGKIWKSRPFCLAVVTTKGELIDSCGILCGGSGQLSEILIKKKELKNSEIAITRLDRRIETAREILDETESVLRDLENDLNSHVSEKNRLLNKDVDIEKLLIKAEEDLKSNKRHAEVLDLEEERILGEQLEVNEEIETNSRTLEQLGQEMEILADEIRRQDQEITRIEAESAAEKEKIVEIRLLLTNLSTRRENHLSTIKRINRYESEAKKRLKAISKQQEEKREELKNSKTRINKTESMLKSLMEELDQVRRSLEEKEKEYKAIELRLKEHDEKINDLKNEKENIENKVKMLRFELEQHRTERESIIKIIEERYQSSFSCIIKEFGYMAEKFSGSFKEELDRIDKRIKKLRNESARFSDVNLSAISQYQDLKNRYDFLAGQREDLIKAIADLKKVIQKINRITQERFTKTFNMVNEKLMEVFPRLFEGGSAKLVLTKPDKPLETGVEFMIHPPGKKLTRMSLLSGGEKAMAAIAFIFSIFLIKQTSFCLMDEIDAPLDEANVYRFNNLLKLIKDRSQVVMVTHNKKTMEFADTLFGITMETRGISKIVSVDLKSTNLPN